METNSLLLISALVMVGLSAGKTLSDKRIGWKQYSWKPLLIAGCLVGGVAVFREVY